MTTTQPTTQGQDSNCKKRVSVGVRLVAAILIGLIALLGVTIVTSFGTFLGYRYFNPENLTFGEYFWPAFWEFLWFEASALAALFAFVSAATIDDNTKLSKSATRTGVIALSYVIVYIVVGELIVATRLAVAASAFALIICVLAVSLIVEQNRKLKREQEWTAMLANVADDIRSFDWYHSVHRPLDQRNGEEDSKGLFVLGLCCLVLYIVCMWVSVDEVLFRRW